MEQFEETEPELPEQLSIFIEELRRQGISVTPLHSKKKRTYDFVADTHIGRIVILDLNGTWEPRLAIPGATYFANATEWRTCLEGGRRTWHAPTLEESIDWLTTTLSEGIPPEVTVADLDRLAGFRFKHGRKIVWLGSISIALALLMATLGLFWLASATKNTIVGINAVACLLIFFIYLFKWARLMLSLKW